MSDEHEWAEAERAYLHDQIKITTDALHAWEQRGTRAEAEREEARDQRDAALAEVARLRGEYERGIADAAKEAARIADHYDGSELFFALGAAKQAEWTQMARALRHARNKILSLLDAAPTAKVE